MALKNLFDPELPFWRWVCNIPHMIALSFLWLVMSLPLITFVPATVALYDAIVKNMRPDIKGLYKRFFKTFKAELKRGIPMSLLWLVITAVFFAGSYLLHIISDASQMWAACMLAYPLLWIPVVMIFVWTIAVEARFNCSFWKLHQNAMVFTFSCKIKSLLIIGIAIGCIVACVFVSVLITILPALLIVLWSLPIESEFAYYVSGSDSNVSEQEG